MLYVYECIHTIAGIAIYYSLAILYVLLKLVFLLTHLSHIMYRQAKSRVTNSTTLTVGELSD